MAATSWATDARISAAIGAPSRSRGAVVRSRASRRGPRCGARGLAARGRPRGSAPRGARSRRRAPRVVGEQLAGRGLVADRRQVDEHVRRGRARRPRRRAAPRPRGPSAALRLLRPASASARTTTSRHASTVRYGTSDAARAACADRRRSRSPRSSSVSARQLHRGAEARVGRGVLVGEGEEPVRERRRGRRPPPRGARRARAYFGRSCDSDATIATRPAARLAATAAALPPPGTGSADASRSTKSATVRSRKRVLGSTRRL